ncbi:MAG: VTT domain-containing protein [Saprospiraceae bacterium]|nr:VTT domain-containing protein [Saprospiraceae bacterium]
MRLILLFVILASLVLVPFFIWGETLMSIFSQQGSVDWLQQFDSWAWVAGILLLAADLVLPIPATLVMASMGFLYGPWLGGLLAAFGSFLSGAIAYGLCRQLGEPPARWLLGERDFERGQILFAKAGGWIVVLSRWLPVFPEVIACMAGMTRMSQIKFHTALAISAIPMGFVYAFIGQAGVDRPILALALSAGVPPLLWLLIQIYWRKKGILVD